MPTVRANYTRVFWENSQSDKLVNVNVGGARSSKSHSIAQLMVSKFLNESKKTLLVGRKTMPSLKATAMHDVLTLMREWGAYNPAWHNKTDHTLVEPRRGNLLRFISIDDPTRVRSFESNYTWLEEANEFTYDDYITLKTRLSGKIVDGARNQMYLSLNPSDYWGWINQTLISPTSGKRPEDVNVINSTWRDNPSLSAEYIKILTGLKDEDQAYFLIYSEGVWAQASNIIYSNYDVVPLTAFPSSFDEVLLGVDFGFNNPAAAILCLVKDEEVWLREIVYQTRLTNSALIATVGREFPREYREDVRVRADESEPDRIEEFKQSGWRIEAAKKGKNSVRDGIDFVKRLNLHICDESVNLLKEIRGYKWREDNTKGVMLVLDEPVKWMDHAMDAVRYALTGLKGYEAASIWPGAGAGLAARPGRPSWKRGEA